MTTGPPHTGQPVPRQSWFQPTFTQGLLVGQASIVILLLILLRFLLFADPSELENDPSDPSKRGGRSRSKRSFSTLQKPSGKRLKAESAAHTAAGGQSRVSQIQLAERVTGYDLGSHGPESSDWVNVLLALAFDGYREDLNRAASAGSRPDVTGGNVEGARKVSEGVNEVVESILNRAVDGKGGGIIDHIDVSSVDIGASFPKLSDVRVRPSDEVGSLRIEAELDYADALELCISTNLVINFPRPRFAVLPIELGVLIERFSGTVSLELVSEHEIPPNSRSRHVLKLSIHPDFALSARARSQLGSRAKLVDVPKLEQLIVERIRAGIASKVVWPRFIAVSLPDLVSSALAKREKAEEKSAKLSQARGTYEQFLARQAHDRAAGALQKGGGGQIWFEEAGQDHLAGDQSYASFARTVMNGARAGREIQKAQEVDPSPSPPGGLAGVEAWRQGALNATGAPASGATSSQIRPGMISAEASTSTPRAPATRDARREESVRSYGRTSAVNQVAQSAFESEAVRQRVR
ncbi:hypothetical protein IE81DRAFT_312939 [Ceraceosorus guamensis]|uniref:Maintenance of mitochondrial morphology protein 1 n=1 Tax=Ceraceosorus guamensis TaxID=1522189 RepID=A0A316W150_9BASI|nr:hypothetical protein IE81DRAFT_312939 [Ceraceosorus guamensis]PWN42848.1 hypothetical protein IE81DRAFT_312939 [Ceraceosorus guamensis]